VNAIDISNYLNTVLPISNAVRVFNEDESLCVVTSLDCGQEVEAFIPVDYVNTCVKCGQGEKINFLLFSCLVDKFYTEGFPEDVRNRYHEHLCKHNEAACRVVKSYSEKI
jgi:hypothetical protein